VVWWHTLAKRTAEEEWQVNEWHFTLEGKIVVEANDLSPKEATTTSRNIKYIGMDVHRSSALGGR